jgi:hypothetical protein
MYVYWIIAAVAFFCFAVWLLRRDTQDKQRHIQLAFETTPNFTPSFMHCSPTGYSFAIDNHSRTVCIMEPLQAKTRPKTILLRFNDILECEMLLDQSSYLQSRRTAALVGAAAGSLAGPVGTVAGAMIGASGKRNAVSEVRRIAVKLLTANAPQPSYTFVFHEGLALKPDNALYKVLFQQAEQSYDALRVAVMS